MEPVRILVVDDHVEVIAGLRALLETEPGTLVVGEAFSGGQAVERALALRPDIVLMDFSMSDMDGVEAAARIHASDPRQDIVILSVYEADEHAERAQCAGVRRWISKSQPPDMLLDQIRELSEELRDVDLRTSENPLKGGVL